MKVVLDGESNIVVSAVKSGTPAQSLETLMDNVWWTHAINGGFFCPADYGCNPPVTSALRIVNGTSLWWSLYGLASLFGFDSNGAPLLVTKSTDISKVYNGMSMQTLVQDWVNVAVLNGTMNSDAKQGKAGNKTFICSTQDNNVVYMWYVNGVTFSTVADYIIQIFDCYNAIQLDNGWTKAMIYKGEYVAKPGRNMMDAFVIIEGNNVWTIVPPATAITISPEELNTAVSWMYNAGLTSKATVTDFLPNDTMTREQASKFFSVFAEKVFGKIWNDNVACIFSDIGKSDPTLSSNITSSCKLGIFKWYNWNFSPKDKLTNAQAITVLMRIMVGTLQEPSTAFYTNYLLKAKEFELVGNINVKTNITRWEAAVLLYKANIYRDKTKNTNTNVSNNKSTGDICQQYKEDCEMDSIMCPISCKNITNDISCSYSQHKEYNQCVNNTRSCTIANWWWQQTWTNNARWNCLVVDCNNWYEIQGNNCAVLNISPTCTLTQHLENSVCSENTKLCTISHGLWQQNRSNNIWWDCQTISCNDWYVKVWNQCIISALQCWWVAHYEGWQCIANTKTCTVEHGVWTQRRLYTQWSTCMDITCD